MNGIIEHCNVLLAIFFITVLFLLIQDATFNPNATTTKSALYV